MVNFDWLIDWWVSLLIDRVVVGVVRDFDGGLGVTFTLVLAWWISGNDYMGVSGRMWRCGNDGRDSWLGTATGY